MINWPETRLRFHLWLHHAWPFPVIAWLRSRGVPESEDFGEFGDSEFKPLTPEQYAVLAKAEPRERGKVIDSLLPAEAFRCGAPTSEFVLALQGDAPMGSAIQGVVVPGTWP